jgi:hypothetical protein
MFADADSVWRRGGLMKKNLGYVLSAMTVVLILATWANADEVRTVTAEGVGAVLAGDMALARDRAIKDAQRNAVELTVGVLIEAKTINHNYTLIKDEIYARSAGYVQDYKILEEWQETGLLRVIIQARVTTALLQKDLDRVIESVERPRILFMVSQQDIGENRSKAWWGGTEGTGLLVAEATLQQHFIDNHFLVVDHALKELAGPIPPDPSDSQATAVGRDYDAEVVILGHAVVKDAGLIEEFDLNSYRAEISARAIQVDNGHVLASANAGAAAPHVDPLTGGNVALKNASEELANALVPKIIEKWVKPTMLVTIDVVDITRYADFVRFKGVLKDQVWGVDKVYQRDFKINKANLEVNYRGTAQGLADELALKSFDTFRIDIVEASQNRLKLRFIAEPHM